MKRYQLFVGGEWVDPLSGAWLDSDDPFTGKPWAQIPRANATDAERAVAAAHRAFTTGKWPSLNATERGALLRRLGDLTAERVERLAAAEVKDNGKRLAEVTAQFRYTAQWFYYYAGLADKVEGTVLPLDRTGIFNYTRYEPLGVVLAITPWNSPLWLMAWKLAPALAAGNTVIVKPSEFASASTLEFMHLVADAGFPPGVVNALTGLGEEVAAPLIADERVAKVTFTGSEATGRKVNELAAKGMKRVTLELGGKSPQIVFDDAKLDDAINGVSAGIFASNGQSCVAGSRVLVQETIYDAFMARITAVARGVRLGSPLDPTVHVGPIATRPQYEKTLSYIEIARADGATCVVGGKPLSGGPYGNGWFIQPTIFADVTNAMRIAREEVFGPVLSVIRFKDEQEAIAIANDSVYGLAAGVWTRDMRRAFLMSEKLQAGTVYVNNYRGVSYMSPAGGYKRSGLGRENGAEMIKDYLQVKSVWLGWDTETPNAFPG